MIVTFAGVVSGVDDWPMSFEVFDGSQWVWAINGDFSVPPQVVLRFEVPVNTATLWNVPVPGVWHFEDEGPLEPPTSGSVE